MMLQVDKNGVECILAPVLKLIVALDLMSATCSGALPTLTAG